MTGPISAYPNGGAYANYAGIPSSNQQFQQSINSIMSGAAETYQNSMAIHQSGAKSGSRSGGGGFFGALKGIATGIVKGAVNTVKSLFTPKGFLMAAAGVALCVVTGGAAVPFLVGAGVALGGFKAVKSAVQGNWEGVGEGLFTVGASVVGARLGPKTVTNGATGETFALSYSSGTQGAGFLARAKSAVLDNVNLLRGRTMLTGSNGSQMTLAQLAKTNATHFVGHNPIALGAQATGRNAFAKGAEKVNGFRPNTVRNAEALRTSADAARTQANSVIRSQYDVLKARVGAGEKLSIYEQGQLNFFARQLNEPVSITQRVATPFQLVGGGAINNPGGTVAALGAANSLTGE